MLERLIKTECGRAKLVKLQQHQGLLARVRLAWFVLAAAVRDWRFAGPDQSDGSPPL